MHPPRLCVLSGSVWIFRSAFFLIHYLITDVNEYRAQLVFPLLFLSYQAGMVERCLVWQLHYISHFPRPFRDTFPGHLPIPFSSYFAGERQNVTFPQSWIRFITAFYK